MPSQSNAGGSLLDQAEELLITELYVMLTQDMDPPVALTAPLLREMLAIQERHMRGGRRPWGTRVLSILEEAKEALDFLGGPPDGSR